MCLHKLVAAFCVCLFAAGTAVAAQDRIVGPVDTSQTVEIRGHVHPSAQVRNDEGPVDSAMPIRYATLYLKPSADLEAFLALQQDPSSPDYRRWLTPEQFGDRFGLSAADLDKIRGWLESQGLQVHDIARGRHWITFSGTAAAVGRAFRTEIHHYRVSGKLHFANASAPSVPAAFQDAVAGIGGLDDFVPLPQFVPATARPEFNTSNSHNLAPDDVATVFNFGSLYKAGTDGTGQKIAVIGRTDINVADIQQFRKTFNLPAKDPQLVRFGPDPGTNNDDMIEADLDLEWAGAIARNADILYVYSASVSTSTQYAVDQNLAPVITYSYAGCELEGGTAFRAIAQQANAQGITWFVSSGDWGAATCDFNAPTPQATKGATVSAPASFPEVTAVGGTAFNDGTGAGYWAAANNANGASALSYIPEKAWNDSALTNQLEATGGGPSGFYSKPAWQIGPGVPADNARDVPDIAFPASPNHYGYLMVSGGKQSVFGGTSLATPVWAGLAALLNQHVASGGLGNINPMLYRMAQSTTDVFHDISTGDNKVPCQQNSPGCVSGLLGFSSGAGYDLATGLGSVDAGRLVAEWNNATASQTVLSATPPAVNVGDTVRLTATVTAVGKVAPSGTVSFTANDTQIGSASLTPSDTGSATATITVPAALATYGNGMVTALYGGDGIYDPSSATATVTLNLPASGSMVVPFVTPNPIYKNGTTNTWNYVVSLTEKAGVDATLTGFTIGSSNDLGLFSSTRIPANGTVSAGISSSGLTPPLNRIFNFTGTDSAGQTWSRQLTVPFLDAPGPALTPAMTLTTPLTTVEQNPQADAACQFAQPITVQEGGGFEVTLASLTVSGANLSSQMQQIFGTQRLAPYGMLQGVMCFPGTTAPTTKAYILTGTSELGTSVTASLNTPLVAAPAAPAILAASPASVTLSGSTPSATVLVAFTGGSPNWFVTISPNNRTSAWLTVSPVSGSGPGQFSVQAASTGLSPGVYNAVVTIEAANSVPQSIRIPVSFQVGSSGNTAVTGLQNAFSFEGGFAPGMALSVYGTNLAPSITVAPRNRFPLPLALAGVSATVNGISAPLYYVAPSQINLQVPYETGAGPAILAVNNGGQIASFPFTVVPAAPGLYTSAISNSTGLPVTSAAAGQLLLLFVTGEGDVTPSLATGATPSNTITDPTKLPHARMPVTVTVGGVSANVLFAGIPSGVAGLTQIDFTVPAGVPVGPQPVVVTVGGIASPPITLDITAQ
jgi:uncharacterized protein (TIGR03437 family)